MKSSLRSFLSVTGGTALLLTLVLGIHPFCSRFLPDKGSQREYEDAMAALETSKGTDHKPGAIGKAAVESARIGKIDEAEQFALKLEALSPTDGDQLEDLHTALGLVALKRGDVEAAKARLLASGRAPETPVRSSFGPTMVLAKGLLRAGEKETVLEYFDLCRSFWGSHKDKLDGWTRDVNRGIPPDFRYNL